jgi:hypothetical protein
MIKEDYVSFETAKLLKAKGFSEATSGLYDCGNGLMSFMVDINWNDKNDCPFISAPTMQMAMKWLRKEHNIYIDILTYTTGKNIQFRWVGHEKGRFFSQEEGKTIYFDSYEQAVEEALSYVLKNLI